MGRHRFIAVMLVSLFVTLGACSSSGSDDTTSTTTSGGGTVTTGGSATTPAPGDGSAVTSATTASAVEAATTTTTADPEVIGVPEYSIQARISGENGDTVVVAVQPATYSDLDIENLVADVVQRFAPITTVHVVDDPNVVDLVLSDATTLTGDELASRDEHYFARLEEGFRLVFEGPFGEVPEVILGS